MLVVALTLALTLAPQGARASTGESEAVAEALRALKQAFEQGDVEERLECLRAHGGVADARVVAWLGKALRAKQPELKLAALQSLRFQTHPDALLLLESSLRNDRDLRGAPDLQVALTKAIGQHGQERSIDLLAGDLWSQRHEEVVQARILALGHIRSVKSARTLFGLMRKEGRERVQQRMAEFRLALMALLGVDQGESQDAWMTWWNANNAKLAVPPEEPPLPQAWARRWSNYWGRGPAVERPRKRAERGRE